MICGGLLDTKSIIVMDSKCTDRVHLVPKHVGTSILPNSPTFSRLLRHAHYGRQAIRDVNLGIEKSYADLISDVVHFRNFLLHKLDSTVVRRLESGTEVYIGVLAGGGYEFAVGLLAVLAVGAAAVPMSELMFRWRTGSDWCQL